ncbi:MAG TPA: dihydroneopterin aldolase [Candidatus Cybelea sp.]|nr:dihydroneopterin aldolase [Candidatus Cybelea sp.]
MDTITLRGIRAYGRIGTAPHERERRQLVEIDVGAEIDLTEAGRSDDLSATLDYAALRDRFVRIVATTSYALLERLGADLLDAVFADARVVRARVTLSKPGILDGGTPSVTLERDNPRYEAR